MKPLLLIIFYMLSVGTMAQEWKPDIPKELIVTQRPGIQLHWTPQQRDSLIKRFSIGMAKMGSGIHYLPQDGMPCIVPDTEDIVAIPNAWSKVEVPFIYKIPNPALPNRPSVIVPKDNTK